MTIGRKAMGRIAACLPLLAATPAWAGDVPLYEPAPPWIEPAPAIDPAKIDDTTPVLVRSDGQKRFENGRVWSYFDAAQRVASPELMGQLGTIALPWLPDKGDLIVHGIEIIRGSEHIDVLAKGARFEVLRREQNLERRELTGELTATLAVQGLRVGDIVRATFSITAADPALKGKLQAVSAVRVEPARSGFSRLILSWPVKDDVRWKIFSGSPAPAPRIVAGYRTVTIALPLPKPADVPADAPGRFQHLPIVAATTFADWPDVSSVMAPLFATDGLIAPGSPLAGEVAKIMAADRTPLGRTERALELVQGQIRYLALGMNGGNYVPQTPSQTWELRYGDCKAKTLMLLAMLRMMGIEAEATLASLGGSPDGLINWLPSPAAFNHVLVRATVDGQVLWLDGTANGARLIDIHDTPALHYVLPLRPAGTGLMPVPTHADARPDRDVALDVDQSAGVDMPGLFHATLTLRGGNGDQVNIAYAQATPKQKSQLIRGLLSPYLRVTALGESAVRYDQATGTATVSASGLVLDGWRRENKHLRQPLDRAVSAIAFSPDRARPAWRDIPVALRGPNSTAYHVRVTLPDGGKGYTLEGDQVLSGTLAGVGVQRSVTLDGAALRMEDRIDELGGEVAPAAITDERARLSVAKTRLLRIVAPGDVRYRWDRATGPADPQVAAMEAVYARQIAVAEADDVSVYRDRAAFRAGIYDRPGAIADLGRALAINPSVDLYLVRAHLLADLGDYPRALADAEAARALDPSSAFAIEQAARINTWQGKTAAAIALADDCIALGGKDKPAFMSVKAQAQADGGDTIAALATIDAAMEEKPGDPALLNERCWIKGTYKVQLDTALKDCTRAIELADNPAPALDSRAMVYFRLDRTEEALADLAAVLDDAPGQAGSRFLRGVILKRLGKAAQAEADLRIARLISPQIDRIYEKYGIVA